MRQVRVMQMMAWEDACARYLTCSGDGLVRLEQLGLFLRDVVSQLPERKFDQSIWVSKYSGIYDLTNSVDNPIQSECGTSACAAGWASCILPGITLHRPAGAGEPELLVDGETGGVVDLFQRLADFFSIPYAVSERLFGGKEATPMEKAAQILFFVDKLRSVRSDLTTYVPEGYAITRGNEDEDEDGNEDSDGDCDCGDCNPDRDRC